MIRLLATDLDGTLLTSSKEITLHTEQTLIQAQQQGLKIILASGRPLCSIIPFAEQLQLKQFGGYIIAYNGSLVWDCTTECAITESTIPHHIIPKLAKGLDCSFHIHGYRGDSILVQGTPDEWSRYIARANKMPLIEVDDLSTNITEAQHKCLITGTPRRLWHLERRINRLYESSLNAFRSESFLLEIVPQGVDKAKALSCLLTRVGVSSTELLCIGDGYNDLGMMQLASIAVAPRNAKRIVKSAANHVTESNDQDGVAHVIDRLINNGFVLL